VLGSALLAGGGLRAGRRPGVPGAVSSGARTLPEVRHLHSLVHYRRLGSAPSGIQGAAGPTCPADRGAQAAGRRCSPERTGCGQPQPLFAANLASKGGLLALDHCCHLAWANHFLHRSGRRHEIEGERSDPRVSSPCHRKSAGQHTTAARAGYSACLPRRWQEVPPSDHSKRSASSPHARSRYALFGTAVPYDSAELLESLVQHEGWDPPGPAGAVAAQKQPCRPPCPLPLDRSLPPRPAHPGEGGQARAPPAPVELLPDFGRSLATLAAGRPSASFLRIIRTTPPRSRGDPKPPPPVTGPKGQKPCGD